MPRYFFNTQDGGADFDPEGIELQDLESAKLEAVRLLGQILIDKPHIVLPTPALTVWVTDASGQRVFQADVAVK
jgi:hypothetical protein